MKKYFSLLICGFLLAASILFFACSLDPDSEPGEETKPTYSVTTKAEPSEGGEVTVTPSSGTTGTTVTVTVKPALTHYCEKLEVDGSDKGALNSYSFRLENKDVTVTAYFKTLPADNYKVILVPPKGGTISFTIDGAGGKDFGPAGSMVTLSNKPAEGYFFEEYTVEGVENLDLTDPNLSFPLPAKHVTVSGVFGERSVDELITDGKDALKSGNLADAIDAYEAAYAKDPNNAEALVYSAIGKLASVAWSSEVGNFFKNYLGLESYPNTLDALINPESWFEYYPDKNEPQYSSSQPPLNVPGWVTGKGAYTDTLVTIDGKSVASSATWSIILIANLIDKNTTGLNGALDAAIAAIFDNPNYKVAVNRTAALKGKDPVKVDAEIIELFGLSESLGTDDIYIGWAELELLLSALKLVKGTLLYVNSYNWTYDAGFVKNLPWDETVLDQISVIIGSHRNKVLPLRTSFMTARGGNYLADSKTAYAEAITSIIEVYDYYIGDSKLPSAYKDKLKEYQGYRQNAVDAKNAIRDGGTFTVPADLVGGQTLTINFGKFFTPGQLALDGLIETEGTGSTRAPVFYDIAGSTPTKISSIDGFGSGVYGIKLTTGKIGEIIGEDFVKNLLPEYLPLDEMAASIAWAVYHWDDLTDAQKDSLTSAFGPKDPQ